MTVEEFFNWDSNDGFRYELVDGEPRAMAPASTLHGFLQNELGSLIRNHLRDRASGCEVVANPSVVPRLLSEHNVRVPDLAVTCWPLAAGQATLPDPVLLIEILSPATRRRPGPMSGRTRASRAFGRFWFSAPIGLLPNCCGVRPRATGPIAQW
jgi:Uma2 family endonuclease